MAGNGVTYLYAADSFATTDFAATAAAADASSLAFATVGDTATDFALYTNDAAGIDDITVDNSDAPVEYYNLQGVKVTNPANGLFIVRQGNSISKQIIR